MWRSEHLTLAYTHPTYIKQIVLHHRFVFSSSFAVCLVATLNRLVRDVFQFEFSVNLAWWNRISSKNGARHLRSMSHWFVTLSSVLKVIRFWQYNITRRLMKRSSDVIQAAKKIWSQLSWPYKVNWFNAKKSNADNRNDKETIVNDCYDYWMLCVCLSNLSHRHFSLSNRWFRSANSVLCTHKWSATNSKCYSNIDVLRVGFFRSDEYFSSRLRIRFSSNISSEKCIVGQYVNVWFACDCLEFFSDIFGKIHIFSILLQTCL